MGNGLCYDKSVLFAVYHVQVRMIVLHALTLYIVETYCRCRTAYKDFTAAVAPMRKLD